MKTKKYLPMFGFIFGVMSGYVISIIPTCKSLDCAFQSMNNILVLLGTIGGGVGGLTGVHVGFRLSEIMCRLFEAIIRIVLTDGKCQKMNGIIFGIFGSLIGWLMGTIIAVLIIIILFFWEITYD